MKYLDLTLLTPQENLACDEALLDWCEEGFAHEILRVWQPRRHFVVLGYSNKSRAEVNLDSCRTLGIPVLRRCSGGGTVLQGPGCLNYSLILRIPEDGPLKGITETNIHIMNRHKDALAPLLKAEGGRRRAESENGAQSSILGSPSSVVGPQSSSFISRHKADPPTGGPHRSSLPSTVSVQGHSDLALGDLKFSGNSQRRKRRSLLFHGSFLLNLDLALVERVLLLPRQQPQYRRHRSHQEFLTNLDIAADEVKQAMKQAWGATEPLEEFPSDRINTLVREKYATDAWNSKF